ncbi:hypothetical protein RJ53_01430 [Methanocalculus chunghsingensis]|uniref:PGF-CTERM archaeal protein-sorting signal domain-containing protein n=2 Tax=Methanocalculus chunghsingensis TaxID=156457 RepID=A0A8J7W8E7_9EURY|nr:hypothetical protein [Methanocalculus chunghsingensis]
MFMALLAVALICMPVSADQEAIEIEVAEVIEHADDLYDLSMVLLAETRVINKDDTISDEIKEVSRTIHKAAHELEHIAEHLQENTLELQPLIRDPDTNRTAIDRVIADIEEDIGDFLEILGNQHDNIHDLEHVVPASHKEHAEGVHNTAHQAERDAKHMLIHTSALTAALDVPAASASKPAESPGFGFLAALAGIAAVVYARRS